MGKKISFKKPFVMVLFGPPGAGKTTFARQFSEEFGMAHVHVDQLAEELLGHSLDGDTATQKKLSTFMTNQFLKSDVSVILDFDSSRAAARKLIRELAKQNKAAFLLVWLQIDHDTALQRSQKKKPGDKFAAIHTAESFKQALGKLQNPNNEDYVVISGKHTFHTQKAAVIKKLYDLGLLSHEQIGKKMAMPGLVNLVPHSSSGKRNISIR